MKSYEIIPSTSASTSESVLQSENVHDDHIVQTEFEDNVFENDDIIDNEFVSECVCAPAGRAETGEKRRERPHCMGEGYCSATKMCNCE